MPARSESPLTVLSDRDKKQIPEGRGRKYSMY